MIINSNQELAIHSISVDYTMFRIIGLRTEWSGVKGWKKIIYGRKFIIFNRKKNLSPFFLWYHVHIRERKWRKLNFFVAFALIHFFSFLHLSFSSSCSSPFYFPFRIYIYISIYLCTYICIYHNSTVASSPI